MDIKEDVQAEIKKAQEAFNIDVAMMKKAEGGWVETHYALIAGAIAVVVGTSVGFIVGRITS